MRILMLSDFYPPIKGGVEQHVRGLSVELVARGHDVAVATLWHGDLPEAEVDHGVRIHRIRGSLGRAGGLFSDPARRYAPPFPDPEVVWALRRLVARERPEIVHAHSWLVHSFLPLKRWSGARLVMTLHDLSLVCAKKAAVYRGGACTGPEPLKCLGCAARHYGLAKGATIALANWAMAIPERVSVDMFVPVSQSVADGSGLARAHLPFQVIPNFLPGHVDQALDRSEPRLAQLPTEPFLLFVGALGRHKGLDVLLRAYARLKNAPPLVLIGMPQPDTPTELPGNVVMLQNWPHDAVMAAWRRSLLAVVPSVCHEAFGIVVLEAMATGRPVIASRIGGLVDLVADGETGLLVPPGDAIALREAIERLINDPQLARRMGEAGKQRVTAFHAEAIVPRIESVYQALSSLG